MKVTFEVSEVATRKSTAYIICSLFCLYYLFSITSQYFLYESVTDVEVKDRSFIYELTPVLRLSFKFSDIYWPDQEHLEVQDLFKVIDRITIDGEIVNVSHLIKDNEIKFYYWLIDQPEDRTIKNSLNISIERKNMTNGNSDFCFNYWLSRDNFNDMGVTYFPKNEMAWNPVNKLSEIILLQQPYMDNCVVDKSRTLKQCLGKKWSRGNKLWKNEIMRCRQEINRNLCQNLIMERIQTENVYFNFIAKSIIIDLEFTMKLKSEPKMSLLNLMILQASLITTFTNLCILNLMSSIQKVSNLVKYFRDQGRIFHDESRKLIIFMMFIFCTLHLNDQFSEYFEFKYSSFCSFGKPLQMQNNSLNFCFEIDSLKNNSTINFDNRTFKFINDKTLNMSDITPMTDIYFETYFAGNKKCFKEKSEQSKFRPAVIDEDSYLKKIIFNNLSSLHKHTFSVSLVTTDIQRSKSDNLIKTLTFSPKRSFNQNRIKYSLLPLPYNSNCTKHSQTGLKSRAHCYDECVKFKFNKNRNNEHILPFGVALGSDFDRYVYQENSTIQIMYDECSSSCLHRDCDGEVIYLDQNGSSDKNSISISQSVNTIDLLDFPTTTVTTLVCSCVSIISFWTGLSVLDVFKFIRKCTDRKILKKITLFLSIIGVLYQVYELSDSYFRYRITSKLYFGSSFENKLPIVTVLFETKENSTISPFELSQKYQFNESIVSSISIFNVRKQSKEIFEQDINLKLFTSDSDLYFQTDLSLLSDATYSFKDRYGAPGKLLALITLNNITLTESSFSDIVVARNSWNLGYFVDSSYYWRENKYLLSSDEVIQHLLKSPYETDCEDYVTDLSVNNIFHNCVVSRTYNKYNKSPNLVFMPLDSDNQRIEDKKIYNDCSVEMLTRPSCYIVEPFPFYETTTRPFKSNEIPLGLTRITKITTFLPVMLIQEYLIFVAGTIEFWIGITICTIVLKISLFRYDKNIDQDNFNNHKKAPRPNAARYPRLKQNTWFEEVQN